MRLEPAPPVEGAPVVLRPLAHTDVDAWYAYLLIQSVVEHTSWNVRSTDDLEVLVEDCESEDRDSAVRYAIVDPHDDSLIGTIGFPSVSWLHGTAEVAYDLKPAAHGRGIASACCLALTEWALFEKGFVRIQATVLDSLASIRVLEKAGFAFEGTLHDLKKVRGVPCDFQLFCRTRTP